jgi:hypothetical protein
MYYEDHNRLVAYFSFFITIVFLFIFVLWGGVRTWKSIQFEVACGGHIKRAADDNTIELAREELKIVLEYSEDNGLTKGSTHLLFPVPSADIGFWHKNIKASIDELDKVTPQTSQLEKTNLLIKLRETLLDHGQGTDITVPEGISIYPYNWVFCLWAIFSILGMVIFGVKFMFFMEINQGVI